MSGPEARLNLISFQAIVTESIPPVDWDIEPLIPQGGRVVVAGMYGSLKSWVLPHMGLSLAVGKDWLGEYRVPCSRRVLYIDEEIGEAGLRRRVRRLGLGLDLQTQDLPFYALSRAGITFDESGAKTLLKRLNEGPFEPDVLFVETLRRVMQGNENEAKDVASFWRNVEPIVRAGKTLIVSHHMNKPNPNHRRLAAGQHRVSGSTDILGGADACATLHRGSKDSVIFEWFKSRDADEAVPFVVGITWDDRGDRSGPVTLTFEQSRPLTGGGKPQKLSKADQAATVVEGFLAGCPDASVRTADILSHAVAQGCKRKTAENALRGLEAAGRLQRSERGLWQLAAEPEAA
jgi:AAA domain-containing protein